MSVDKNIIRNVCEIVNHIDDSEKAYDKAIEYLHIIGDMESSPYHHKTIALVDEYLKKGNHPSEGMVAIFNDKAMKGEANICCSA